MKKQFYLLGISLLASFMNRELTTAMTLRVDTICCIDIWPIQLYSISLLEACLRGNEVVIAFYDTPQKATIIIRNDSGHIIAQDSFLSPQTIYLYVDEPRQCCTIEILYNGKVLKGQFLHYDE